MTDREAAAGRAAGHLFRHARRRGVDRDHAPARRVRRARTSTRGGWCGTTRASTGPRGWSPCARPGTTSGVARSSSPGRASVPWMLNSAAVFAWNTDKAYLTAARRERRPGGADGRRRATRPISRQRSRVSTRRPWSSRRVGRRGSRGGRLRGTGRVGRRRAPASAPARGWCSHWSSRCAPRGRPPSSCSAERSSPRPRRSRPRARSGCTRSTAVRRSPSRSPTRRPTWPVVRSRRRSSILGERARLRPGRPDAPRRRHPGRQRARGDRARPLSRGPARQCRRLRRPGRRVGATCAEPRRRPGLALLFAPGTKAMDRHLHPHRHRGEGPTPARRS